MGEEKNRVLPEALNYQGLLVVTTKQLTELYHCTRQNIDNLFRKYKNDFIEGEDYFKVEGKDLRVLKNQFAEQSKLTAARQLKLTTNLIDEREKIPPFSNAASSLYLWTKSGALKLSEYINTDMAKLVYSRLAVAYFPPNMPEKPKQLQLFQPEKNISVETCFNFLDKLNTFLDKISIVADENLRDDLIRAAFKRIELR